MSQQEAKNNLQEENQSATKLEDLPVAEAQSGEIKGGELLIGLTNANRLVQFDSASPSSGGSHSGGGGQGAGKVSFQDLH